MLQTIIHPLILAEFEHEIVMVEMVEIVEVLSRFLLQHSRKEQ
jgi:hypothetical protein